LTLLVIFSVAYTFIKLKEGHSHFFFAQRTLLIFIVQALSSPQMGLVSPRYISNFPSSFQNSQCFQNLSSYIQLLTKNGYCLFCFCSAQHGLVSCERFSYWSYRTTHVIVAHSITHWEGRLWSDLSSEMSYPISLLLRIDILALHSPPRS
jgi:hypothetical protein